MDVNFADEKIKKLCEQSSLAQKKLGAKAARKLKTRLADLFAARCVVELVAGRPHPVQPHKLGKRFYQKFSDVEELDFGQKKMGSLIILTNLLSKKLKN